MQHTSMVADLALLLAMDCSSSVDAGDFDLQRRGVAEALRAAEVFDAIKAGENGRIVIAVVHWSTRVAQTLAFDWHVLETESQLVAAAAEIETIERHWIAGGTGLAAALNFCAPLFKGLGANATRKVIDISGDGEDNEGGDVAAARNACVAQGIIINGLPIVDGSQVIEAYYHDVVIGGPGAFSMPAVNLLAFKDAMTAKLLREIRSQIS